MNIGKHIDKKVCNIKRGVAFDFEGNIFLKINDYFDVNAVELKTGLLYHINPNQRVTIYDNAKVVLK